MTIVFTDDSEIQNLNREFRAKDKPTDVLSFESGEDDGYLGDIVISVQTARRQAPKFNSTFKEEIFRLMIHGVLHLLGYDHEGVPSSEAQKMRRLERKLFDQLVS